MKAHSHAKSPPPCFKVQDSVELCRIGLKMLRMLSENQLSQVLDGQGAEEAIDCLSAVRRRITFLETNIGVENQWLEDYFPFGKASFQVLC